VSRTGRVPLILVANPNTIKVNSVKELIEAAKKAPGKIDYGAPGPGSCHNRTPAVQQNDAPVTALFHDFG
jgi:tripartite-type tricarboxylate transporter receptor subunit TctC